MRSAAGDDVRSEAAHADLALLQYIEEIEREPHQADSRQRRLLKRAAPAPVRLTIALALTDAMRPVAARRARHLARRRDPVLVQLGSGRTPKAEWINVDLVGKGADVPWNLRRTLPFASGSVDGVFHEHVLEHFKLADGYALTKEIHRVLRPGGILRVAVPDAGRYVAGYSSPGAELELLRPQRPTPMLALQEVFLRFGHRAAYDVETLKLVLVGARFDEVTERQFAQTALPRVPDSEHRRAESIYVEGRRRAES